MKIGSVLALAGLALTLGASQVSAQAVQFKVPIYFHTNTIIDSVIIGVSGDGPNPPGTLKDNSFGFDLAADVEPGYADVGLPPVPPPPYDFDGRLMTIPGRVSTFPTGLGAGAKADFHGFRSAAQVDSFKIVLSGDNLDSYDTQVSWPAGLAAHASSWTIKPQTGSEWPSTNMLTSTSLTLPAAFSSRNVMILISGLITGTAVEPVANEAPKAYVLAQNYPNPFNPATNLEFTLLRTAPTTLRVYNVLGQQVAELVNGVVPAGVHRVTFDATRLSSGVYFYQLRSGAFTAVRKMTLIR